MQRLTASLLKHREERALTASPSCSLPIKGKAPTGSMRGSASPSSTHSPGDDHIDLAPAAAAINIFFSSLIVSYKHLDTFVL